MGRDLCLLQVKVEVNGGGGGWGDPLSAPREGVCLQ